MKISTSTTTTSLVRFNLTARIGDGKSNSQDSDWVCVKFVQYFRPRGVVGVKYRCVPYLSYQCAGVGMIF